MTTAVALRDSELMLGGPIGSLDHYIQALSGVSILTKEEEFELATQLRESDDLEAAQQLILSHLRFVVHIARGYSGYGLPLGDLIQEGNIGLMKAVKRFDPEVGVRLVSFAVHWIRAEIHEYVLKNWRLVKVATTKAQSHQWGSSWNGILSLGNSVFLEYFRGALGKERFEFRIRVLPVLLSGKG